MEEPTAKSKQTAEDRKLRDRSEALLHLGIGVGCIAIAGVILGLGPAANAEAPYHLWTAIAFGLIAIPFLVAAMAAFFPRRPSDDRRPTTDDQRPCA